MIQWISLAILGILALLIYKFTRPSEKNQNNLASFPGEWKTILEDKIGFYRKLSLEHRLKFEARIFQFLQEVKITGVEVEIDDNIRLLVASSAIIPVFYFENWYYVNLGEILVYNGLVDTHEPTDSETKNLILGQVRPFQNKHLLLLSKPSLVAGFESANGKENVGFHEFVHLIDGADGETDGVPKALMPKELLHPWTNLMYQEIEKIKKGDSDINPYGLTNHAEFFAVVSEYFFENPEKFKEKHEALYEILSTVFIKNPSV